jgi:hypothetical protein
VIEAAQEVGVRPNQIYNWKQRIADEGTGARLTGEDREELLRLRKEIKKLRIEKEILKKASVTDLLDLSGKLHNVNVAGVGGAGTNNASFTISSLGSGSRNSPNSENSVGLYIDDAYYGKTDGAILDVIDVENIEVLRGPRVHFSVETLRRERPPYHQKTALRG